MQVQVDEVVNTTEKCFVVKVFPFDDNTNFPKCFAKRTGPTNFELSGFLKRVVARHLAKHGALEVA